MSTARPRKTPARGTTRKRNNADAATTSESVSDVPAIDASPLYDSTVSSSPISDSWIADGPAHNASLDDSLLDGAEHEIRLRAYELYLSRGGADGDDLSDWLEAERLVRNSRRGDSQDAENRSSPPA
jgi:hypothetical protein